MHAKAGLARGFEMDDLSFRLGDHGRYHARSYAISAPNFDTNTDDRYNAFSVMASVVSNSF